jgi:hypothetical protein
MALFPPEVAPVLLESCSKELFLALQENKSLRARLDSLRGHTSARLNGVKQSCRFVWCTSNSMLHALHQNLLINRELSPQKVTFATPRGKDKFDLHRDRGTSQLHKLQGLIMTIQLCVAESRSDFVNLKDALMSEWHERRT